MKPFKLEAKHLIPLNKTAYKKCATTQLLRDLIQQPDVVVEAIEKTALRFTIIPQKPCTVHTGIRPYLASV